MNLAVRPQTFLVTAVLVARASPLRRKSAAHGDPTMLARDMRLILVQHPTDSGAEFKLRSRELFDRLAPGGAASTARGLPSVAVSPQECMGSDRAAIVLPIGGSLKSSNLPPHHYGGLKAGPCEGLRVLI